MTLTAVAAPAPVALQGPDLERWLAWLKERIDPAWRPGEWDSEAWFFAGDPDNEGTAAYWCTTKACPSIEASQGMCACCGREWQASGLDRETFLATHIPDRRKGSPGRFQTRCQVERDGQRCAQPKYCQGLCMAHYRAWRKKVVRHPDSEVEIWSRMEPLPLQATQSPCLVARCAQERLGLKVLCSYHAAKHRRDARDEPVEQWAAQQTPFLFAHQFSLIPLKPLLRWEILYGLQRRDKRGGKVDPTSLRMLVRLLQGLPHLIGTDRAELQALVATKESANTESHVKEISRSVQVGYEEMCGIKPTDKPVWDLPAINLASSISRSGRRRPCRGTVDFTVITQTWLRDMALDWARQSDPSTALLKDTVKVTSLASRALAQRPGGGSDLTRLGAADMDAIVAAVRAARREDGEPAARSTLRNLISRLFALFDFGRRTGLMAGAPTSFARQRWHNIGHDDDEDETGKAIPEPVIAQLDAHLESLGTGVDYGRLTPAQVQQLFRTAYIVLRDTGRRPREICSLRLTCLDHTDDGYDLIWDNHKSRRARRRLPITAQTAEAIRAWLPVRERLEVPSRSTHFVFPALSNKGALPHMHTSSLSNGLRRWVDALPQLDSAAPGPDGSPLPFDRSLIYPYAFRHSYAQRHADAGIPVDVLKELMDHRSISTTMGYYKITMKRKRAAVTTMRMHVIDRSGAPAPIHSNTAYEARSVAVPFGNCIEPSNVKAGGNACPIRFQCSGCGFYRPDPSYLLAIEEHINSLRADRETAQAMDADAFVTRNLDDQIAAFRNVVATMHDQLAALPTDERLEIEEASAVLRKSRASHGRTALPLTVINRRPS
ncbi:tyrosine-type recombinase/integrase [Streptomyces parvus]